MSLGRTILLLGLLFTAAIPVVGVSIRPVTETEAHWQPGWQSLAAESDDGFVVWESCRNGHWRLLRRDLIGGPVEIISPDDGDREHYAPHISPDGTRIVYATMPAKANLYRPLWQGEHAQLRIMNADGTQDRELVARARGYFEDRVVVWIDDDRLYYIDEHGATQLLTLSTMEREQVADATEEPYGWLFNATGTHATRGWPMFGVYDSKTKRVLFRRIMNGCQPYFSRDGRWGFWTAGAGGPLNRYDLETRKASPIIERGDTRLPAERGYLYFPMLSACQTAFAFAASPFRHDHFKSDYDVFVGAIDPFTLELIGKPQRYSFDPHCDRFPDVFYSRLELGKVRGTAPFVANFDLPGEWRWDFGDGSPVASTGEHTYDRPGNFWVTATRADQRRRGYVRIDAPAGPEPVVARFLTGASVEVRFDRPIALDSPSATLDGEARGSDFEQTAPDTLRFKLATTPRTRPTLVVRGVRSTDEAALPTSGTPIEIQLEAWPFEPERIAFAFESGQSENVVPDTASGQEIAFAPERRGAARFDHRFALELAGGSVAFPGAAENLTRACRESGAVSFEITIEFGSNQRGHIARIEGDHGKLFELTEDDRRITARIHTGAGAPLELDLGRPQGETAHVAVSAGRGRGIYGRIDGLTRLYDPDAAVDLSQWRGTRLVIGDDRWHGTVHHIAAFASTRTDEATTQEVRLVNEWLSQQPQIERRTVTGVLRAKSAIPTLEQINPYRDAIAVFEYEADGTRYRVKHWVMLDGRQLEVAERKIGWKFELELEPSAAHPELEATYVSDTLEEDFELEDWFSR